MLIDSRIIARHGEVAVVDRSQLVAWRDGSTVTLHRVQLRNCDQTFVRALRLSDSRWVAFDVRTAARTLDHDLRAMPARDHDGMVLFTLRQSFETADALIDRARENAQAIWLDHREQLVLDLGRPCPAPRIWTTSPVQAAA